MGQSVSRKGLYSAFQVEYLGDKAGVTCALITPTTSTSSRPKDKHHRETFSVVTTSHSFNRASLQQMIATMSDGSDPVTLAFLEKARDALEDFIEQNGETNPHEAVDWEPL